MTTMGKGGTEIEFYRALKAVVLHFIRHDQDESLYKPLLPMVQEFEAYTWRKKTLAERKARVREIEKALSNGGPVDDYFKKYPHDYSKKLYDELTDLLSAYREDLGKEG